MKGATDGGLNIPHSVKKFPGFKKAKKKANSTYDAGVHRDRIFGAHIDAYMKVLKEKGDDLYQKQFNLWDKCLKDNGVSSVEDLFEKVFAKIRENPKKEKKDKKRYSPKFLNEEKTKIQGKTAEYRRDIKLTNQQRKDRVE